MDAGVGVGTSCADANTRIEADARMNQAIFIGGRYACESDSRKCDLDSGEHRLPAFLFGSLPKSFCPVQISLSFAQGVVGKLPITAERPALPGVYLRGWAWRCLVSLLSGFGDGRNTASRSVHNHLRC